MEPSAPGWYGKIASLGDFAGRRLPPEFVNTVDQWLQRVIPESRQRLGEGWMEAYLTGPVWRFVFFPAVIGSSHWAGVMMPSVDKVGRYFPLLIAGQFEQLPGSLDPWLDRLEDIALATLDTAATPEGLETPLLACPPPRVVDGGGHALLQAFSLASPATLPLPQDVQALDRPLLAAAFAALSSQARGHSLWWAAHSADGPLSAITTPGLPDGSLFATLLRGSLAPAAIESAFHATPP